VVGCRVRRKHLNGFRGAYKHHYVRIARELLTFCYSLPPQHPRIAAY
jgi:hypothetical protein